MTNEEFYKLDSENKENIVDCLLTLTDAQNDLDSAIINLHDTRTRHYYDSK